MIVITEDDFDTYTTFLGWSSRYRRVTKLMTNSNKAKASTRIWIKKGLLSSLSFGRGCRSIWTGSLGGVWGRDSPSPPCLSLTSSKFEVWSMSLTPEDGSSVAPVVAWRLWPLPAFFLADDEDLFPFPIAFSLDTVLWYCRRPAAAVAGERTLSSFYLAVAMPAVIWFGPEVPPTAKSSSTKLKEMRVHYSLKFKCFLQTRPFPANPTLRVSDSCFCVQLMLLNSSASCVCEWTMCTVKFTNQMYFCIPTSSRLWV